MSSAKRHRSPGRRQKNSSSPPPLSPGWFENWWAGKSPIFWFSAKFCALLALSYAVLALPICRHFIDVCSAFYAGLSSAMLNLLGERTHLDGATISSARFAITVVPECAGPEFTQFFCALVLAFPSRPLWRIAGIIAGASLLPLLNLLRIMSLYFIGVHFPGAFESMHERIWATILIGATLVLSFFWIKWAAPTPAIKSDAVAA